jgi:hypothetical protein
MKPFALGLMGALLVLSGGCKTNNNQAATTPDTSPATAAAPGENAPSFTGEIMDSAYATMGSHDKTMKQENAADAKVLHSHSCPGGCFSGLEPERLFAHRRVWKQAQPTSERSNSAVRIRAATSW